MTDEQIHEGMDEQKRNKIVRGEKILGLKQVRTNSPSLANNIKAIYKIQHESFCKGLAVIYLTNAPLQNDNLSCTVPPATIKKKKTSAKEITEGASR